MLAYSKPRKCTKCGQSGASTEFCNEPKWGKVCWQPSKDGHIPEEHLHRVCLNCGFEWLEKTVEEKSA